VPTPSARADSLFCSGRLVELGGVLRPGAAVRISTDCTFADARYRHLVTDTDTLSRAWGEPVQVDSRDLPD